jgi:hypothetical protein
LQEARHRSAVWWRHVNRLMSLFGILLVAVATTLVVIGVHQRWGVL